MSAGIAVGHSIPTRWKMAEERSSEPVSAAGVHEEGAMGRGCYRRQLKRKHDLVQLSLFKSRKGEWGVQGITTLGLKGRVIRTASAPACFLCQAAGSKELEALASSPQPTARWASPTLRPTPLPHLPPLPPHSQQRVWGVTASIWPAEGSTAPLCGRRP